MGDGAGTINYFISPGLVFVVIGLILILTELILSIGNGLDLVFIGSAVVIGGLVTWPFNSWILTIVVTSLVCIAYVVLGRKYVHRWTSVAKSSTNIDAVLGKTGVVLQKINSNGDGLVRVGHEDWRAKAEGDIEKGEEIIVKGVNGVTLVVEKYRRSA